uniref:X8 domain-containing protein n=1 Tax=Lotus japonicus TaxID=34305 RepID=I3SY25_LOTJA|nr:unknown [Lotus japonicus]
MDHRHWHLALFCLSLFFGSGLGTVKALRNDLGSQLDDVPIVNPITPGTGNPYLNPTTPGTGNPYLNPTTPQPPDTTGQTPTTPNITPTTPTPTTTTPTPTTTTPTQTTPGTTGGQWCVARPDASDTALQTALDYACGYGGADCSAIQPGASCYEPNTVRNHASYAFNEYHQKNPVPTSCDFGGTASLASTDPSSGSCSYDASSPKTTSQSPPVYVSPPSPVTITPTVPTPPDTTMYGSESTESPNTASSAFNSLLMLFASGLLGALQLANYF